MKDTKEMIKAHRFFCRKSQHYIFGGWNEHQEWWRVGPYHNKEAKFNWTKFRYTFYFPVAYVKFMWLAWRSK